MMQRRDILFGLAMGLIPHIKSMDPPTNQILLKPTLQHAEVLYDALLEKGLDEQSLSRYCHDNQTTREAWRAIGRSALAGVGAYLVKTHLFPGRGKYVLLDGRYRVHPFPELINKYQHGIYKTYKCDLSDIPERHMFDIPYFGEMKMVRKYGGYIPDVSSEWKNI